MNRLAVLLLALLAGCWTAGPMKDKAEPPPAPGVGVVQSIESTPANPAAGGSAGSSTKRIGVRMADNTIQYLDTRAVGLAVGDRVEITPDGNLRRPAP